MTHTRDETFQRSLFSRSHHYKNSLPLISMKRVYLTFRFRFTSRRLRRVTYIPRKILRETSRTISSLYNKCEYHSQFRIPISSASKMQTLKINSSIKCINWNIKSRESMTFFMTRGHLLLRDILKIMQRKTILHLKFYLFQEGLFIISWLLRVSIF